MRAASRRPRSISARVMSFCPGCELSALAWRNRKSRRMVGYNVVAAVRFWRGAPGSISNLPQSSMRPPRGAAQEKPGMPENTSNWYEATRVSAPLRARLNFDLDVDVCVVGAGLAGLTVAREVAERGWSVAVLETGR